MNLKKTLWVGIRRFSLTLFVFIALPIIHQAHAFQPHLTVQNPIDLTQPPPLAITKSTVNLAESETEEGMAEKMDNAEETPANDNAKSNEPFVEGKQYKRLSFDLLKNPQIQQFIHKDPGKIQVIEFFNYGCSWCGRLSRYIDEWEAQKPAGVAYYRFPLVFNKHWEALGRFYYAIRRLGKDNELDTQIFDAIHHKHINLADQREMLQFMENHGIDNDTFLQAYNSNAVTRQIKQGNDLSLAYRISVSPVLIINTPKGSFFCDVPGVGNEKRLIQLLNHLIENAKLSP